MLAKVHGVNPIRGNVAQTVAVCNHKVANLSCRSSETEFFLIDHACLRSLFLPSLLLITVDPAAPSRSPACILLAHLFGCWHLRLKSKPTSFHKRQTHCGHFSAQITAACERQPPVCVSECVCSGHKWGLLYPSDYIIRARALLSAGRVHQVCLCFRSGWGFPRWCRVSRLAERRSKVHQGASLTPRHCFRVIIRERAAFKCRKEVRERKQSHQNIYPSVERFYSLLAQDLVSSTVWCFTWTYCPSVCRFLAWKSSKNTWKYRAGSPWWFCKRWK